VGEFCGGVEFRHLEIERVTRAGNTFVPVAIVGAGLAGLACARTLAKAGVPARILEASDGVGGRVRTDIVDGFRLDRGFQVFFAAYPEARAALDYAALDLRAFTPGALIRAEGRFYRVLDPVRRPLAAMAGALAPIGSFRDKAKVLRFRRQVLSASVESIFSAPEQTAEAALRAFGFSDRILARFFRPLFGGIFLERELATSSRMLRFVYRMMAEGDTTLPAEGMEAIPRQLAAALPEGAVRLRARVTAIEPGAESVLLLVEGGEWLRAGVVVLATEGDAAAALSGLSPAPRPRPVTCVYFSADRAPIEEPLLLLDGEGRGPVTTLAVPSLVAPGYAPAGGHLISATVLGAHAGSDAALEACVRHQLAGWFGAAQVARWRRLAIYRIPFAQFEQTPGVLDPPERPVRLGPRLFVCGDHVENASINGAMRAGRRAAEAVLAAGGGASG
jgi:phytoene dehydrogenase-like protein